MDANQPPFRAEVIGSLLRPRALKDAVAMQRAGLLPSSEADAVLDREVARVIACQEAIGFRVVTDGELARTSWFGFFFEAMAGFRLAPSQFKFKDALGRAFEWQTCVAAGPVSRRASITLGEYQRACRHLRQAVLKVTMPAPSAFLQTATSALESAGAITMASTFWALSLARTTCWCAAGWWGPCGRG